MRRFGSTPSSPLAPPPPIGMNGRNGFALPLLTFAATPVAATAATPAAADVTAGGSTAIGIEAGRAVTTSDGGAGKLIAGTSAGAGIETSLAPMPFNALIQSLLAL